MQRSTIARRAAQLLPCDDDDETDHGAKHKQPKPARMQVWLRRGNLGALLLNMTCVILFLNSGVLSNVAGQVRRRQEQDLGTTPAANVAAVVEAAEVVEVVAVAEVAAAVPVAEAAAAAATGTETPKVHHHTIPVRHAVPVTAHVDAAIPVPSTAAVSAHEAAVAAQRVARAAARAHHAIPVRGAASVQRAATVAATTTTTTAAVSAPAVTAPAPVVSTTSTTASTNTGIIDTSQPLQCREYLKQVKAMTYPVTVHDPNLKRDTNVRKTATAHPFRMSFHHEVFDRPRWEIYKKGYYYEHALEKIWTKILEKAEPGARVLDVGYVTVIVLYCCDGLLFASQLTIVPFFFLLILQC
jgi:hypothetical protein